MYLKGVFTTFVGLATIVGTYMYAVDNKWIEDVPDLRVASKTIEIDPTTATDVSDMTADADEEIAPAEAVRSTSQPKPTRARRAKRRIASSRTRRTPTKRRMVSIFKVAKDIPHPNTQR